MREILSSTHGGADIEFEPERLGLLAGTAEAAAVPVCDLFRHGVDDHGD